MNLAECLLARSLLVVPAVDRIFDDLFRFVETSEFLDFGCARLLEILVVVEVEVDLLDEALRQVFEGLVLVAVVAVVGRNGNDFVIDFAVVDEFHDAEDASDGIDAGRERLVSNQENVELIAVFVQSLRDEAVVGRFCESNRLDAVEHEASVLAIPFDFVVRTGRNLDNDVDFAVLVVARGEDFIEICHKNSFVME